MFSKQKTLIEILYFRRKKKKILKHFSKIEKGKLSFILKVKLFYN